MAENGIVETNNDGSVCSLEQRHRQQRKDLQAHIMNLKRSVTKGDKKKKREVLAIVAKLEAELDEKQAEEEENMAKTTSQMKDADVDDLSDQMENLDQLNETSGQKGGRTSKAQRRRKKKAEKEREREQSIAEQERQNLFGARHLEGEKLKAVLKERHLTFYEVPSDGDCLYAAVVHQLSAQNEVLSTGTLRQQTAQFMRDQSEDFLPFLSDQESSGEQEFTPEKYSAYCDAVESTKAWGGQLELRAISQVLKRPIEVLQASGPTIIIGEEYEKIPLVLTYHRHVYGLGEHYNSVTLEKEDLPEDTFT